MAASCVSLSLQYSTAVHNMSVVALEHVDVQLDFLP